jgi:epoxyqueuosine reductase QueG
LYAPYKVNPALCVNPLTRKEEAVPQKFQSKMGNWVCGCDVCQEVCPINRELEARIPDPRSGFDPLHHASHRTLGGLTRTPDLRDLIKHSGQFVMRRNAVIAIGNVGSGEGLRFLQSYSEGVCESPLKEYLESAIQRITLKAESPCNVHDGDCQSCEDNEDGHGIEDF